MLIWADRIGTTKRTLESSVDVWDVWEQLAFYQMHPYGSQAEDFRAALVATTIHNAHAQKKDRAKIDQYMPKWDRAQRYNALGEDNVKQLKRMFAAIAGVKYDG